jgi:hypothetical protein
LRVQDKIIMLAEEKEQTSMRQLQFTTVAPCLGAGIPDLSWGIPSNEHCKEVSHEPDHLQQ